MDPKGHTEAITEIVQEGITENLPNVPGTRLEIQQDQLQFLQMIWMLCIGLAQNRHYVVFGVISHLIHKKIYRCFL